MSIIGSFGCPIFQGRPLYSIYPDCNQGLTLMVILGILNYFFRDINDHIYWGERNTLINCPSIITYPSSQATKANIIIAQHNLL